MLLRTKLHGKIVIHEYDNEFTNTGASIRLFVSIRGRFDTNPTMNHSSFLHSSLFTPSRPSRLRGEKGTYHASTN